MGVALSFQALVSKPCVLVADRTGLGAIRLAFLLFRPVLVDLSSAKRVS